MSRPFYPLLFALFPVLALYAHNAGKLTLSELWMPLGAAFGLALAVLLLAWAPLRDVRRAGVIAILLIAPFFCYGYAKDILTELGWPNHPAYLVGTWVIALAVGTYLAVKTQKADLRGLTAILNLAVVALVAFPAVNIGIYEFGRPTWTPPEEPVAVTGNSSESPDIYYIILDMYPRADVLEEYYGFDNSEFINWLESRGFYVPTSNLINHGPSSHSMASALNMGYLNYLAGELGEEETDMGPVHTLLHDNKVWRLLKPLGYRYVHMGSYWWMTRNNKWAHDNLSPAMAPEFPLLVAQATALRDFSGIGPPGPKERHRSYALEQFEKLIAMPESEEPLFVFAHIIIPHGPFVFDRKGSHPAEGASEQDKFIGQLEFCNRKVMELVDNILSKDASAVIILQGDHGAGCEGVPNCEAWDGSGEPSALFTELAVKNFAAYHLPVGSETLYDTITPVNTFRVVFNAYFGMAYEMLESRQYLSSYNEPYRFIDVTEIVQGTEE